MKSMNEKISIAHDLAVVVGNAINREQFSDIDDEDVEVVWGHADGLTAKWLYDRRDGKCSLQAFKDFDPVVAEAQLDKEILMMQELSELLP